MISVITEILVFHAKSADRDQTPHFAASDHGLHYLPMSLLWDGLRRTDTLLREGTLSEQFYPLLKERSTIKGKKMLSLGANSFVFEHNFL